MLIPFNKAQESKKRDRKRVSPFFLWIIALTFGIIVPERVVNGSDTVSYDARNKRDPFVPLVTLTTRQSSGLYGIEGADDIAIEGIVYDRKKGSVVVLNGAVLREGEETGSVKVLKIESKGVKLLVNGSELYKPLYTDETKGK